MAANAAKAKGAAPSVDPATGNPWEPMLDNRPKTPPIPIRMQGSVAAQTTQDLQPALKGKLAKMQDAIKRSRESSPQLAIDARSYAIGHLRTLGF